MVFTRLGLGLAVGCTIPFLANDMVYMTIANSFLRPHLRFFIERDKLKRDVAVSTYLLDSYIKDVVGSFFLFFFAIGPVIYDSTFRKKKDEQTMTKKDEVGTVNDDKYTQMIK